MKCLRMVRPFVAAVIMLVWTDALLGEEPSSLVWRGCGVSKIAFMEECGRAYEQQTGVKIRLSGGGATLGIDSAASGGADLGGTCRACLSSLKEDELPIKLAVVAWDALAVIVHNGNPVQDIRSDDLRAVLEQKITNWKTLGGNDEPIIVVCRRGKTSGVGYSTRQLILGDVDAEYGRTAVRLNSSGPVEQLVERQPKTIAITGISSARKRNLQELRIDGQEPTAENIASGKYPYYRPLYIAFRPGENPAADRFVEWLLGEKGQKVIEEQGTVSLRQGAKLTSTYKHFTAIQQIYNYKSLLQLAAQSENE